MAGPANDGAGARTGRAVGLRVLLVLAASLLAAEGALRVRDRLRGVEAESYLPREVRTGMYEPHPYLGVTLRPGFERPGRFSVTVNSLGVRGPERPAEKPDGVYRIFCLGGSTTFGTAVSEDAKSYPGQLEWMLNMLPDRPHDYEVWNCGVPGYTTAESLVNFALRLADLEPDAVLVYHAVNDARPIQTEGFRSDYAHFRTSWRSLEVSGLERSLLRWSRLYATLAPSAAPDQGLGDHLIDVGFEERLVPSDVRVNEAGVAAFVRNLRHLVALARHRGADPVLSTFAWCEERWRPEDLRLAEAVERLNEAQRALGAELDVPVLEIASLKAPGLFSDWVHLNDHGSSRHARLVVLQAVERGLFGL